MLTGGFLALINLLTIVFNRMGFSILGYGLWKIMIYSFVYGMKQRFAPSDNE